MASKALKFSRFNEALSLNYFFFANTNRNSLIKQNFIENQFLLKAYSKSISKPKNADHGIKQEADKISTSGARLEKVASKVLTCQEPEASSSQNLHYKENLHIPFEVQRKTSKLHNPQIETSYRHYLKLTKPNLTVLVTLSSICSYAISPYAVSIPELMFLTLGTALCSGAANAINMGREPDFDRKMPRTLGRPVVRGVITPKQAYKFATATGSIGTTMLYFGVNPTVALLGFSNIVIYSWFYTSLKRKSIINTWVGAIVGAIPPLMGWAASSPITHPSAWMLVGLLFAWQFPHFNALSHNVAEQYKKAGYVMAASENPMLNARVALRYSLIMFPLCFGLSYFGTTDWVFPFDSAIPNGWLSYLAFAFWRQQRENYANGKMPTKEGLAKATFYSKKLFWCSVWQLPTILILAMLHKKHQWDKIFSYIDF